MGEKLFVIMEVTKANDSGDGTNCYLPVPSVAKKDGTYPEYLWLKPERIIPASRLKISWESIQSFIIPAEPLDEWSDWLEGCPVTPTLANEAFKEWLRRMPRSKK